MWSHAMINVVYICNGLLNYELGIKRYEAFDAQIRVVSNFAQKNLIHCVKIGPERPNLGSFGT